MTLTDARNVPRAERRGVGPVRDVGPYSARNTSKGALIEEAHRVFSVIRSGSSIDEVREETLRGTLLSQRSSVNRKRIWTLLQQRYLVPTMPWITSLVAEKSDPDAHGAEFVSLLYLLYAFRDRLTFDFVATVLWPRVDGGRRSISRNDVLDLLITAAPHQPQIERWSEATRVKLAGSVLTALRDFGLLTGKQKKSITRPRVPLSTAAALVRLLVVEGKRGRQVLEDPAWRLFLLTEAEVAQFLARLAQEGAIRFERAGSTVVLETPAAWEDRP